LQGENKLTSVAMPFWCLMAAANELEDKVAQVAVKHFR
jgi:hypothetical protein